jgi:hypothetical protein
VLRAQDGKRVGVIGDPDTRDQIRLELFQGVEEPKGRDLAGLDFAEAAFDVLGVALEALPGSRRPRADDLLRAAGALGAAFVRHVLARHPPPTEALVEAMSKALGEATRLDPDERAVVVRTVLPALVIFVDEVCGRCPVACLSRPKAGVADAFFSREHPAFG